MFCMSRWKYSGVPGCGAWACAGAAAASAATKVVSQSVLRVIHFPPSRCNTRTICYPLNGRSETCGCVGDEDRDARVVHHVLAYAAHQRAHTADAARTHEDRVVVGLRRVRDDLAARPAAAKDLV